MVLNLWLMFFEAKQHQNTTYSLQNTKQGKVDALRDKIERS